MKALQDLRKILGTIAQDVEVLAEHVLPAKGSG